MAIQVEDDGMQFEPENITTEAITLDDDYQGWRIRFRGALGNARVMIQVDIGIGDVVTPSPVWIDYPVLLDQPAPRLMAYTPETAIAEKYQAMVELDKPSTFSGFDAERGDTTYLRTPQNTLAGCCAHGINRRVSMMINKNKLSGAPFSEKDA